MANTRFNYDDARTVKILQESTGPGRYILNTPGNGEQPAFFDDPHMRQQRWGANLMQVPLGHPIDIDSDLIGLTQKLGKHCEKHTYDKYSPMVFSKTYPKQTGGFTHQSRATHPAWMYLDRDHTRKYPLFLDPQEHVARPFMHNLNTRILERDSYDLRNDKYKAFRQQLGQ